jgi:DNA-binding NarL/FixJ family response regulator
MTNVFIADDHRGVRREIVDLLQTQSDMRVVGQAENGADALRSIRELQPDVVLMDIKMPRINGIDVTAKLHGEGFLGKILIVTQYEIREYVCQAIAAGALGYLIKDTFKREILPAIRSLMVGKPFFSSTISQELVSDCLSKTATDTHNSGSPKTLTAREREILEMVVRESSTEQISEHLSVSVRTVDFHVRNILQKLGVQTMQQLRESKPSVLSQ